jgi:hypothetical protein
MKVKKVITPSSDYGYDRVTIVVDNDEFCSVRDFSECPEDANTGRDLSFVYGIPKLLKKAYEAGKNGDSFDMEEIKED